MRNLLRPIIRTLLVIAPLTVGFVSLRAASVPAGTQHAAAPAKPEQGIRYNRLVVRNVMMIDGRGGTPAEGPVDLVIEKDTIADIVPVDGVSLAGYGPSFKRPTGDHVIEATGMYVIPGLIDMHAHIPTDRVGERSLEYGLKLWLAHGVTTLRDPGADGGFDKILDLRAKSAANQISSPRVMIYKRWPRAARSTGAGHTPEEARALVREWKAKGADGIKVSKGPGQYPDVLAAICDEARKNGMGVAVDLKVSETDAVVAANAGVTSIEHWYGIPDAAIPGTQDFPPTYNYLDELDRFRNAGKIWKEAAQRPDLLDQVLNLMLEKKIVWDPTFVAYEANRDFWRIKSLPWQSRYAHPQLLAFWEPNPTHHASYFFDWTTHDEVNWKEDFRIWMSWLKKYWERGGTVTVGSDAGSLYALYGFSTIRELELQQEAGLHPVDVIRNATTQATRALGLDRVAGIRVGYLADLAVIDGNPLENFKVMYGLGVDSYTRDGKTIHHGGVKYTIKEGIVFDAPALLHDVEEYVRAAKARPTTSQ